jgi:hypothetical protein
MIAGDFNFPQLTWPIKQQPENTSSNSLFADLIMNSNLQQLILEPTKVDSSCKKPLVICNSIFFIFLNQIKAQTDQKIIVWVGYFPYKYSFKVISND